MNGQRHVLFVISCNTVSAVYNLYAIHGICVANSHWQWPMPHIGHTSIWRWHFVENFFLFLPLSSFCHSHFLLLRHHAMPLSVADEKFCWIANHLLDEWIHFVQRMSLFYTKNVKKPSCFSFSSSYQHWNFSSAFRFFAQKCYLWRLLFFPLKTFQGANFQKCKSIIDIV